MKKKGKTQRTKFDQMVSDGSSCYEAILREDGKWVTFDPEYNCERNTEETESNQSIDEDSWETLKNWWDTEL